MEEDEIYYMILYTPKEYLQTIGEEEFISQLETCDIIDLEELLKVFEYHELYEQCAIINNILKQKLNETN